MNQYESSGQHMLQVFDEAHEYFAHIMERPSPISILQTERLRNVFAFVEQSPEVVLAHTASVEVAIARFNDDHIGYSFDDDKKNAKQVSRSLTHGDTTLPTLGDLGASQDDRHNFLTLFTRRVERNEYGFVEHIPESSQLIDHLVMAMIIDGYGLGARMKLLKDGISVDDVTVVNAICEEVDYDLETELLKINWFSKDWGFAPEYEDRVKARH